MIISNDMTWKTHLYGNNLTGDDKIVGLVTKLSQRVGILSKLVKIMTPSQFSKVCDGLFTSKLTNCLEVFGNVWGLENLDEETRRTPAFNKEDNRRLQVVQNKCLRLRTGLGRDTPTADLVKAAGDLSVHQWTAFMTIMTVFRVLKSGKPKYLADKMQLRRPGGDNVARVPLRHQHTITIERRDIAVARGGFVYRGAALFNSLPLELRQETSQLTFKRRVKKWVSESILVKPP